MITRLWCTYLAVALLTACATPTTTDKPGVTFSPPTESDAIQMQTTDATSAEVRKDFGEPKKTKTLDDSKFLPCTERWFYIGRVNVTGLGPIEMMTYVDFDAQGRVCRGGKGA